MELNDMKAAWQQLDRKLSRQNELQFALLREQSSQQARSNLRPLSWGMGLQVLFGLISVLFAVPFWIENIGNTALMVNGMVVHAYGIIIMVAGGYVLHKISRIDHSAPVLKIQKQLLDLKKSYIRCGWFAGLPWWFLWLPYSVVVLHATKAMDMSEIPSTWYWANLVFCFVGMIATGIGVRWALNPQHPERARKTEQLLAGVSLTRAQTALDELAKFEQADEPVS